MPLREHLRLYLESLGNKDILFKRHFRERTAERPITEALVRECLREKDRLIKAEQQPPRRPGERKYRLWFKLSSKYCLVVIAVVAGRQLHVVTAWNRRWHRTG